MQSAKKKKNNNNTKNDNDIENKVNINYALHNKIPLEMISMNI